VYAQDKWGGISYLGEDTTEYETGKPVRKHTTPLEPDVNEHKFYARGVGPVLALALAGGGGREELLRFTKRRK
jgi:hypothetical protein